MCFKIFIFSSKAAEKRPLKQNRVNFNTSINIHHPKFTAQCHDYFLHIEHLENHCSSPSKNQQLQFYPDWFPVQINTESIWINTEKTVIQLITDFDLKLYFDVFFSQILEKCLLIASKKRDSCSLQGFLRQKQQN